MKLINKTVIKAWGIMLLIAAMIFIIAILLLQKNMIFFPKFDEESYNILKDISDFYEVEISKEGRVIRGWLKKTSSEASKGPLLIYCGGNAQNSSSTMLFLKNNHLFDYFANYNFLYVDYPEYGLSTGALTEKSVFETVLAAYDYGLTLDFVDTDNIVAMGYSIGTGPATYLASQRDIKKLILLAPYDELASLYNKKFNVFHGILKNLIRYKFTSYQYAEQISSPVLIITSHDDEVINYQYSKRLSEHFNNLENCIVLDGIRHSGYLTNESALESINKFLNEKR